MVDNLLATEPRSEKIIRETKKKEERGIERGRKGEGERGREGEKVGERRKEREKERKEGRKERKTRRRQKKKFSQPLLEDNLDFTMNNVKGSGKKLPP